MKLSPERFGPDGLAQEDLPAIQDVRRRLLNGWLSTLSILGFPAAVSGAIQASQHGMYAYAVAYLSIYAIFLGSVLVLRKASTNLRSALAILSLFAISVVILTRIGLSGEGDILLVAVCVMTAVLLGLRTGLVAVGVCVVTLCIIGAGMVFGFIPIDAERMLNSQTATAWITTVISFTMISIGLIISPEMFQRRLNESLEMVRRHSDETELANQLLRDEMNRRMEVQDALRESEQHYRDLVQSANSIILRMDTSGRVTFFNAYAERFFGYAESEILGKSVVGTIVPNRDGSGRNLAAMIEAIGRNPEKYASNENENMKRDGRRVWIAWTNRAVFDKEGTLSEILCVGNDMTERKKLEEQLRHVQRMEAIGTLAGGIAHDFNNLLASITGYTELALLDGAEDEKVRSHLHQVLSAGKRGKHLVDQILAFSRETVQEKRPTDMKVLVEEGLGFVRATLPTTVEIREDVRLESAMTYGEPTQIHQVLMNLCTNAGHAMQDQGGVLEVGLAEIEIDKRTGMGGSDLAPGVYLDLKVRDTGHGMDRAILDRIFDPFFTTKERGRGTGMGLAVVHGIVKGHGGAISVESEVGKGTTFHVFFPRYEREEGAMEVEAGKPLSTNKACILLVDDEEAIVSLGHQMLERMGHEVVGRTSSFEALEAFRAQPDRFDLVVTDLTMPKMTGIDLAQKILEIRPDIPIVLCTGFSEPVDPKRARGMGIRATLRKPFLIRQLTEAIREALA
jgi:PAS domain S-box-containing protein